MNTWRYWRNLLLFGLLGIGLVLPLALLRSAYQGATYYVHPPRLERRDDDTPAALDIAYTDLTLTTADGLHLAAWYTPPQNDAIILVGHGFGSHRLSRIHALFARHGYGVVSWDFRAHGDSAGDLCTIGYNEWLDVAAALDFAQAQGAIAIGAWGESMGGAAILRAAARRPEIAAVVTDSTFATIEDELEAAVRIAPMRPMVRFFAEREAGIRLMELRPVDEIGRLSPRPVFIIHGEADSVAPVAAAHRLYAAAGEPRTLWIEPGVEHIRMSKAHPEQYEQRVIAFFDAALGMGSRE